MFLRKINEKKFLHTFGPVYDFQCGRQRVKFNKGLLPASFNDYFKKPSHQHNTRYATSNNNFEVIQITSASDKSRLKYIGPKIWMDVPLHIKHSMSLKVFVKSFRNYLIGNYDPND